MNHDLNGWAHFKKIVFCGPEALKHSSPGHWVPRSFIITPVTGGTETQRHV